MHFSSLSEEERREWFSWCIHNSQSPTNDDYNCAIVHKSTVQMIGWFGIGGAIEEERIFGYLLARPFWGYGYMTEALRAMLSYEFETLNTTYIRATCATANIASAKVMERVGM